MHNLIVIAPSWNGPFVDHSASCITRTRDGKRISCGFVAGSVEFHTRRYVHDFGYTVTFAERKSHNTDKVWLEVVR